MPSLDSTSSCGRGGAERFLDPEVFAAFFANARVGTPRFGLHVPAFRASDRNGILVRLRHSVYPALTLQEDARHRMRPHRGQLPFNSLLDSPELPNIALERKNTRAGRCLRQRGMCKDAAGAALRDEAKA